MNDPDQRWRDLHGQASISPPVGRWLRVCRAVARPLARRGVSPDAVTVAGLVLAILSVPVVAAGSHWPLLAAVVVGLAGLADGVDGAVAVLADRTTRTGALLDAVCDRVSDVALAVALWAAGARADLVLAGIAAHFLLEYARARAQGLGMSEAGVITVGERPTRVIVVAAFLLAAGVFPGPLWPTLGAIALLATGVVALAQLLPVAFRALR